MKKIVLVILVIILLAVILCSAFGYLVYREIKQRSEDNQAEDNTQNEQMQDEETDVQEHGDVRYKITNPEANTVVTSPVKVEGEITGSWYFEGEFMIMLFDDEGNTIGSANARALHNWMTDELVPFEATLTFDNPTGDSGEIVLIRSNPSGLPENEDSISIPVRFNRDNLDISLYFGSTEEDPEVQNCDVTYPVQRSIPYTVATAEAALERLLEGPTSDETDQGFFTSIPVGTELNSIRVENGVAYADFNENLQEGVGGSCKVSMIRSQIEETLLQFNTVEDVEISVNGQTENILQP